MATIRALWDSDGELVNRNSAYFPLRNALFDLPPYRGKWPEIWIGPHARPCCAPLGAGFAGTQDLVPYDMDEKEALSHAADIPPSLLREFLLNGTPDEVVEQAAQWRDCGVRYIVQFNVSFMQRSLRKGLMSVMPFNKIVRGLRKL
jgi:alkanesulfonate monooxygenase SsuD/methylene tetrahydromethanopterin reductase-like flavin-dependent oxidoreductase (luciferase family)